MTFSLLTTRMSWQRRLDQIINIEFSFQNGDENYETPDDDVADDAEEEDDHSDNEFEHDNEPEEGGERDEWEQDWGGHYDAYDHPEY